MSKVFAQHQLLRCQTIGQCMMLNADVRRGGGGLVKCGHLRTGGGGMKRDHFLRTSFMNDPLGGWTPLGKRSVRKNRVGNSICETTKESFQPERQSQRGRERGT